MSYPLDVLDQPHLQLFLRLMVGGLLLLAGITKLADRASFRDAVAEYELLPGALVRPFAALLPWVELTLGTLLLVGFGTAVAAGLAVPLFLAFGLAIGVNIARGRSFDCHCFGAVQRDQIGWPALARSVALAAAALVVVLGVSRFGSLEAALFGASGNLPSIAEVIPVVFLAFVVLDLIILLPEAAATQLAFAQNHGQRGRRTP